MRLLKTETGELCRFDDESTIPAYAALSYCREAGNVILDDLDHLDSASRRSGFPELGDALRAASDLGMHWLWEYNVCTNQSSSAEVDQAANYHFQLYRNCQVCLAYLDDVTGEMGSEKDIEDQLRRSRWSQRSWALPELIAPREILFYDQKWNRIGTKTELAPILTRITRVDQAVLDDAECLSGFSIGRRMSWAAGRSVTRPEDTAYSLLGLFAVNMPIIYGEGRRRAFIRLQEEISKDTDDASVFAWQASRSEQPQQYRGLFAISPAEFGHFATITPTAPFLMDGEARSSSAGITIDATFETRHHEEDVWLVISSDVSPNEGTTHLGISFRKYNGRFVRSSPQEIRELPELSNTASRKICIKRDIDLRTSASISECLVQLARVNVQDKPNDHNRCASMPGSTALYNCLDASDFFGAEHSESICTDITWSADNSIFRFMGRDQSADHELSFHGRSSDDETLEALPHRPGFNKPPVEDVEAEPDWHESDDHSPTPPDIETERGEYEEDDMYLFTSPLPERFELTPLHPYVPVKQRLVETALKDFSLSVLQSGKRTRRSTANSPSRKRVKHNSDEHIEVKQVIDSEDEETVRVDVRRYLTDYALACPFYVLDPTQHQTCLTRADLRSIKDVKRHLWAEHRRPYYCPVCRHVFATAVACDQHISAQECALHTAPDILGVTTGQLQLLAQPADPALSTEMQWFAIWDIIFPDVRRPPHAYLLGDVEKAVRILRDYWARNGEKVVADVLRDADLWGYEQVENEEQALMALKRDVLDMIVDEVVAGEPQDGHVTGFATQVGGYTATILDRLRAFYAMPFR